MIGIINTNFGNISAIKNIYFDEGIDCKSVSNISELDNVSKLIIPGIGNFDNVIENLKNHDLFNSINYLVTKKKIPILGICIGMHLFFDSSEEGKLKGFGWLKGEVKKLNNSNMRYPHMGWNNILNSNNNSLFKDIKDGSYFYFLHSYGNQLINNEHYLCSSTIYGDSLLSSISYKNIYGVQFHPEKSHQNGIKLLTNFAKYCA